MLKTTSHTKCSFLRKKQTLIFIALFVNVILFIYFAFIQSALPTDNKNGLKYPEKFSKNLDIEEITIIIREFEDFENNLEDDIKHYNQIFGLKIDILIIVDNKPYPPLKLNLTENVKLLRLAFDLDIPSGSENIIANIRTKTVLFVTDGCRIANMSNFKLALQKFTSQNLVKAYAIQTGIGKLSCPGIQIDRKRWTVKIEDFTGNEGLCDFIDGDQAMLMKTKDLIKLASPFTRPVQKSLYFQFALRKWKSLVYDKQVFFPRLGLKDSINQYQHKRLEKSRLESTYKKFGMHQIIYNRNKHNYIGCTRDTERCFGSVVNDVPDYIYLNKWTPPCCLKAIRETALHVFQTLEKHSVRYWLEGGSLLGAARNGDIIPWDYDVDIGIYQNDIPKCKEILKAKEQQYVDDGGFLWEKGFEGDFFRVHYSDINRNHVDIFPFYSKKGIMTKNTWFKTHPQDMEFPEHYLKPLITIPFIGRNVSAPNHFKDFLELKFGKGVIQNPKYPNSNPVY
ncbi:ribitol 5-phosphate transferase FKRP-like [Mytilus edulis]|uniref:ribitol 5-phosphate transferase FKRP-like n=1 Tax=Mytilus edulis TaxID=6550 RepID=UPI0039F12785